MKQPTDTHRKEEVRLSLYPPTTFIDIDVPSSVPKSLSPALKRKKRSGLRLTRNTQLSVHPWVIIYLIYFIDISPPNTGGKSRDRSFQLSALSLSFWNTAYRPVLQVNNLSERHVFSFKDVVKERGGKKPNKNPTKLLR